MGSKLEKMGAGLYVRKDTPKHVRLTESFVEKATKGEKAKAFKETMKEIARQDK